MPVMPKPATVEILPQAAWDQFDPGLRRERQVTTFNMEHYSTALDIHRQRCKLSSSVTPWRASSGTYKPGGAERGAKSSAQTARPCEKQQCSPGQKSQIDFKGILVIIPALTVACIYIYVQGAQRPKPNSYTSNLGP